MRLLERTVLLRYHTAGKLSKRPRSRPVSTGLALRCHMNLMIKLTIVVS